MINSKEKRPTDLLTFRDKPTLNCLNINQQNGMTRIYGAIQMDTKKSREYFDKLVRQLLTS